MADEKDMKADIDTLFSKVNKINTKISEFEVTKDFFKEMIERNTIAYENLSSVMHEMQITMIKMSEKMDDQSEALVDMRKDFEEAKKTTNDRIDSVEKSTAKKIKEVDSRVDEVEDKGKFDIHLFIKKNWPWITTVLGVGILYVAQYVKF